jgi:hypothetical protein
MPRQNLIIMLAAAAVACFFLLTIRDGQHAGDFAMYVRHAINIVDGNPYAESGYVQNPAAQSVGTVAYPPGVPLVLAPVYAVSGLDLNAMKVLMVVFFVAFLIVLGLLAGSHLRAPYLFSLLVIVGFLPYFWDYKDNVESDFPFLFPVFLSMLLVDVAGRTQSSRRRGILAVAAGITMFVAISMRPIGLVLPIALLLYDLISRRRWVPGPGFWIPASVCMVLVVLQNVLLPLESGSYAGAFLQQVKSPLDLVAAAIGNAKYYMLACVARMIFANGFSDTIAVGLAVLSVAPLLVGLIHRVRTGAGIVEVFFVCYGGILLIWPFRQPNYMIPMYPLIAYYVILGIQTAVPERFKRPATVLVMLITAITFIPRYVQMDYEHVSNNLLSSASSEVYEYVQTNLDEDVTIVARAPRSVALFTGRTSTPPDLPAENRDRYTEEEATGVFAYFEVVGADYALVGPKGETFHREILPLWHLVRDYPQRFELVYANDEWQLYRLRVNVDGETPNPSASESKEPT